MSCRAPGAGRPFGLSARQAFAFSLGAYVVLLVLAIALERAGEAVLALALACGTGVGLVSLIVPGVETARSGWWGRVALAGAVLGVPLGLALHAVGGDSVVDSLCLALAATVLILALVGFYRGLSGSPEWLPTGGRAVLAFALATVLPAAGAVGLGIVPGVDFGGTGDLGRDVAWFLVVQAALVYGSLAALATSHPVRGQAPAELSALGIGTCLFGLGLATLAGLLPQYPLDWVIFIPALELGLMMSSRHVAYALLAVPLCRLGGERAVLGHELALTPRLAATFLLLTVAALVTLLIVSARDRAARVSADIAATTRGIAAQSGLVEQVIDHLADGVLLLSPTGGHVMSNPAARMLLGPPGDRAADEAWWASYDLRGQDGRELPQAVTDALSRPAAGEVVQVTVGAGGTDELYLLKARSLHHRRDAHTLVTLQDVTAEQRRARELEAFAGTVAHDLKGPLAAVSVWLDTADEEAGSDLEMARYSLGRARAAGLRMSGIIEDCLLHSVTRQGVLRPRDVDLGELAREVAAGHATLDATLDVALDATVRVDPTLVRRLLGNLFGNAVKYARPGEAPWVRVRSEEAAPGWVRVLVEDRGIGITEEEAVHVFDRYSRTAKGAAHQEGTGLGLALCRSVVERHHGEIAAAPNAFGGTTVSFTLPQSGPTR